jgi:hypothetical protein
MRNRGINVAFHYQPVDSSPVGKKLWSPFPLLATFDISERLIGPTIWIGFVQHEKVLNTL